MSHSYPAVDQGKQSQRFLNMAHCLDHTYGLSQFDDPFSEVVINIGKLERP